MVQHDPNNHEKNDSYIRLIDINKPQDCKQECRYFWKDLANIAIPFIFFTGILWLLFMSFQNDRPT